MNHVLSREQLVREAIFIWSPSLDLPPAAFLRLCPFQLSHSHSIVHSDSNNPVIMVESRSHSTVAEERLARRHERFLPSDNSFKFVTECFYITQRALHVGLIPAIDTFSKTISDLNKQIQAQLGGEKILKDLHAVSHSSAVACLCCSVLLYQCTRAALQLNGHIAATVLYVLTTVCVHIAVLLYTASLYIYTL